MESQKFSLSGYDFKRIALHLVWYALGYGVIAAVRELTKVDFGGYNELVGLAGGAIIDSVSRFIAGK